MTASGGIEAADQVRTSSAQLTLFQLGRYRDQVFVTNRSLRLSTSGFYND